MQKKVYMTVDGNRMETAALVLKASDNTQKTASLEADVTLDLEAKALGTVNLGQSYTVNPSTGKDGMSQVTFDVPTAQGGGSSNPFAGATNPDPAEMMPVAYAFKKMLETSTKGTFSNTVDTNTKFKMFDTGLDVVHGIVICSMNNGHYTTGDTTLNDNALTIIDNDSQYFVSAFNAANKYAAEAIRAGEYYNLPNGKIYVEGSAVYIQNNYNGQRWAPFPSGHTYMWFAW